MDQQIGRYQILDEIASGGQGTVYRVFDPDTGQIVALKVLHPSLAGDSSYLDRFRREASLTAAIDHPNVVKIFEVGSSDGRHFIAMEYLAESLAGVINTHMMLGHLIVRFGTEAQKALFLPKLAVAELHGVLCLTEPDAGTDLQGIKTQAKRDGDEYVINGSKMWITNGMYGSLYAILT